MRHETGSEHVTTGNLETFTFGEVEVEWVRRYTATLALLLPGQFLIVETRHPELHGSPGMAPYFQVLNVDGSHYVLEVPGNDILAPPYQLTVPQTERLRALGLMPPHTDPECCDGGEAMWRLRFPLVDVAKIAGLIVTLLGDVFALPHPAFGRVVAVGSMCDGTPDPCTCLLDPQPD